MYKIIAMDFDDTILTNDKRITKESIEYLKDLKSKGYIIVGVTGRNLNSVLDIGNPDIFNYLVLNNGCDIYDVDKKVKESIYRVDRDIVKKLIYMFRSSASKIDCCTTSSYYYISDNVSKNTKPFIIKVNDISEISEEISRMNIFLKDNSNIEELEDSLSDIDNIDAFIMQDSNDSNRWLVIMPRGVNKSSTLELLAKRLNLSLKDVIFFGDGANDVELMKSSGLGVAMSNALEEVKNASDDITLSNEEDGVINYLKRLY